jgi:tetratricopeptide (TPR) repeat protein
MGGKKRPQQQNEAAELFRIALRKDDEGDLEGALADYDRVLELSPLAGRAYTNRGRVRSELGDSDGAVADFTRAIELDPTDAIARCNRGICAWNMKRSGDALADFSEAIRLRPDYWNAYSNRGIAYLRAGRLPEAITDFTVVIECAPGIDCLSFLNRGRARCLLGEREEARADFGRALAVAPREGPLRDEIEDVLREHG